MESLKVVIVLFVLSLVGALVLFKFFVSFALIKGKTYQAGGAIAGFILLYILLFYSHSKINDFQKCKDEKEKCEEDLQIQTIKGEVSEYDGELVKIILSVRQTEPDSNGRYILKAPGLDPENNDIQVHVLTDNRHKFFTILTIEEMDNFQINLK